jgi:hypothetical protein
VPNPVARPVPALSTAQENLPGRSKASPANSPAAPGGAAGHPSPIISLREYQQEVFNVTARELFLLWKRQSGKSHLFGAKGFHRMATIPGHAVWFVNASILMGVENILKEAQIWRELMDHMRRTMESQGLRLTTGADDEKGNLLDVDAVADLFEHSKLESRVWHSNAVFSRSRVVAPNPMTARGMTGDVLWDEVGFSPDYEAVYDALEPIISSNSKYILWAATTPSADSDHPIFSLLMPKHDDFQPNPRGNWYRTEEAEDGTPGTPVHRFDAKDSDAAGFLYFDKQTKQPVTWDIARARARNKVSFDRNYLLKFTSGGNASIPRHLLLNALAKDTGIALDLGTLTEDAA